MGIFDALLRRAPGVLAQGLAGKNQGERILHAENRQRTLDEQNAQRQALQEALLQYNMQRQAAADRRAAELFPVQKRHIIAQTADEEAQAAGTGRYAPKPEKPIRPEWETAGYPSEDAYLKYLHRKGLATHIVEPKEPKVPPQPGESERRAAGILHMLEPADKRVDAIEEGLSKKQIALSRGGVLGRFGQSPEGKQYDDDLKSLVAFSLYAVSGATANPGEVENQVKMLRINEADDPATKLVKRQRRKELVESVRLMAGRAAPKRLSPSEYLNQP